MLLHRQESFYLHTHTVTCDDLPPFLNGMISYNPDTIIKLVDTVAMFSCHDGFVLTVESMRTCEDDGAVGVWSGAEPICAGIIIKYWNPSMQPRSGL